MRAFIALISGTIFGLGLTIASMTNPAKVIGFLNIFGAWDPSLAFVMLGAILVSAPVIYIQKKRNSGVAFRRRSLGRQ